VIDAKDNVATALTSIQSGNTVMVVSSSQKKVCEIKIAQAVPFGHKLAIKAIRKGDKVIKYGEPIGHASRDIGPGDCVHIDNVNSNRIQLPKAWYSKEP